MVEMEVHEPEIVEEAEIDPALDRLNRLEEVQRQFIEALDGISRAIGHMSNEIYEVKNDIRGRIGALRDVVTDHVHGDNGAVLVSAYMAKETM